jgi:hypothetical protein
MFGITIPLLSTLPAARISMPPVKFNRTAPESNKGSQGGQRSPEGGGSAAGSPLALWAWTRLKSAHCAETRHDCTLAIASGLSSITPCCPHVPTSPCCFGTGIGGSLLVQTREQLAVNTALGDAMAQFCLLLDSRLQTNLGGGLHAFPQLSFRSHERLRSGRHTLDISQSPYSS